MTNRKYNQIARLSRTHQFFRTFTARLNDIPKALQDSLTAKQIAAIIDGPMEDSYQAGFLSAD